MGEGREAGGREAPAFLPPLAFFFTCCFRACRHALLTRRRYSRQRAAAAMPALAFAP